MPYDVVHSIEDIFKMMEDTLSVSSTGSNGNLNDDYHHESSMNHPVTLVGGHNKYEWVYLLLCIPNAVTLIVITAGAISQNTEHCVNGHYSLIENQYFRIELLACLMAGVSIIFALYGLFAEHQYDLYLHSVMIFMSLFFLWIGFGMKPECLQVYSIVCNCVGSVLSVICCALAWKATHVPDWVEFWIIGVSEVLANMYRQVCYFLALLRLDSILVVVFSVYSISAAFPKAFSSRLPDMWYWLAYQLLMLVFALSSWGLGKATIKREDMYLLKSFQVVNAAYICYIIAQEVLIIIWLSRGEPVLFHVTSIVLGLLCFAFKIHVMQNMNKTSKTFGHELSSPSFNELVSRNSNNLLVHPRSDLRF